MAFPQWPRLFPENGTIGLCSPSGPSPEAAIERAVAALEARGHRVVVGEHTAARHPELGYLAGTDEQRAFDLNHFLRRDDIDLILCARGGYGAARILDRLDIDAFRANPKPLVGYSDITALNLAFLARAGTISYSGIMATAGDGFGEDTLDPFSEASFFEAVRMGAGAVHRQPDDQPLRWIRPPKGGNPVLRGRLLPVCLTLLESLVATPFRPALDGGLLLIEDVDENLYAIDRALTQLRLAGLLEVLGGVIVGSFTGTPEQNALLADAVPALVAELVPPGVPVAAGAAYGHIPRRLTLPVGALAEIDIEQGTYRFHP